MHAGASGALASALTLPECGRASLASRTRVSTHSVMLKTTRFIICLATAPLALAAQTQRQSQRRVAVDTVALQRLLMAEDSRGQGRDGLAPILENVTSTDPLLRRTATRALGRLQQPGLAKPLIAALTDRDATVRAIAAEALAQAMMGTARPTGAVTIAESAHALGEALADERMPNVADELARSLGRLPYVDSSAARAAESMLVTHAMNVRPLALMRAFYSLAARLNALQGSRRSAAPSSTVAMSVVHGKGLGAADAAARRVAMLTIAASGVMDSVTAATGIADRDAQVRALAMYGARTFGPELRRKMVRRGLADSNVIVRLEALRWARADEARPDCTLIHGALGDMTTSVRLAAIDALAEPCADSAIVNRKLDAFAKASRSGPDNLGAAQRQWHAPAHALVALAHTDPARAIARIPRFVHAGAWQARMYAARAASVLQDSGSLRLLAADPDDNVRAAAIDGAATVLKHSADDLYLQALSARGYQVIMSAARALAGSTNPATVPTLLDALARLSAERRENSRDPRMAVLARLDELGRADLLPRLLTVSDFDSTVAIKSAAIASKLAGTVVAPQITPLPIRDEPLAATALGGSLQLRITMAAASGGGVMVVQLHLDEAPTTVARVIRLARAHYYDGLTFHRIEPIFVLQGGSPGATEYIGDGPFMRDELGSRSNARGTFGISTRGRDTGDAQLYINVMDNPRLDHDYTVFGTIVSGLAVIDRVLEGDTIARVEVLRPTRSR
jgi:cyclophilin family peptidyl-prolyl cis-trans isomerase/HEAT repeat protein